MTEGSRPAMTSLANSTHQDWEWKQLNTLLEQLVDTQKLRQIDLQLGRQILIYETREQQRRRGKLPSALAFFADQTSQMPEKNHTLSGIYLAACLVSQALGRGQVCLPLTHCPVVELSHRWLSADQWVNLLRNCQCVWVASTRKADWQNQPLVLEWDIEDDHRTGIPRLYLARYYFYQFQVAQSIRTRLESASGKWQKAFSNREQKLPAILSNLFPAEPSKTVNWQLVAAATACVQPVCVITGGPGTGKTTTVTRLLTALLNLTPDMRIALAAPTGKAAARMMESIRQARQRDDLPENVSAAMAAIPEESYTLHRLLGWTPNGFRYHARHPLSWDCIVVDEASMVDLAMMYQLLEAMSPDARLILLGDKDQLASVEAGSVLADLCNAGADIGPSEPFVRQLQCLTGYSSNSELSETMRPDLGLIQNAVAELRVSHRFGANSGIGQLAKAVNGGRISRAEQCFELFTDLRCDWIDSSLPADASNLTNWHQGALKGYRGYCRLLKPMIARSNDRSIGGVKGDVRQADDAIFKVLEAFNHFRVLVATRKGNLGLEAVNRDIERLLVKAELLDREAMQPGSWYIGRPVMITRNDYDLGLYNGDIGILVLTATGQKRVAFLTVDGSIRYVLPSRLPSHETAFGMTVHKSQGSEFNHVQLLLPERWQSVVTRELIYTAITRSREYFYLMSGRECWQRGLGNRVERASGLKDALWNKV